ncbi:hypothetical protein C8R44DRAFT_865888 [Mycena epipterygia]|nr:hypothetical protein C8R44DRAFT_865888 [Mycena epipterygia]
MASVASALISIPTTEAFNPRTPPSPPLVVLFKDTPIHAPNLPPLFKDTNILATRSAALNVVQLPKTRVGRTSTPYPSTGSGSGTTSRMSSPLTSLPDDDGYQNGGHHYPPTATPRIRRPQSAQRQYCALLKSHLRDEDYEVIFAAVACTVLDVLDLSKSYHCQKPAALKSFTDHMYKQFP